MRQRAEILIFMDLGKALDHGFKFLLSANGVVLCEGDENGFLPPEYFLRVETAWNNLPLPGYEAKNEMTGAETLDRYDDWIARIAESKGLQKRPLYKWEDPIQKLFEDEPARRQRDP